MANITVTNRSTGTVAYSIPEMKVNRLFSVGETKPITEKELNALWSRHGGAVLIMNDLQVNDKEWCKKHWNVPIEYFWGHEEIKKCLMEDSVELFSETIDYAPGGVIEIIKQLAWQLPLSDRNKAHVLREKLNFDVENVIKVMTPKAPKKAETKGRERLRKEE